MLNLEVGLNSIRMCKPQCLSGERETHTCISGQAKNAQLHGFTSAITSETQHTNHLFTLEGERYN